MIRNPACYVIAHASRFVRLALVRVESSALARLPNVEFRTPSGRIVVIVLNRNRARQPIARSDSLLLHPAPSQPGLQCGEPCSAGRSGGDRGVVRGRRDLTEVVP